MTAVDFNIAILFVLGATLVAATLFSALTRGQAPVRGEVRSVIAPATVAAVMPVAVQAHNRFAQLSLFEQFAAVASVIHGRAMRTETVLKTQNLARERLDATELSLRRLVAEVTDVMTVPPMASFETNRTNVRQQHTHTAIAA